MQMLYEQVFNCRCIYNFKYELEWWKLVKMRLRALGIDKILTLFSVAVSV